MDLATVFSTRSIERGQKLGRLHAQAPGELDDDVKGGVPHAALDAADVGPVQVNVVREGFLGGPALLFPQLLDPLAERAAMLGNIHTSTFSLR